MCYCRTRPPRWQGSRLLLPVCELKSTPRQVKRSAYLRSLNVHSGVAWRWRYSSRVCSGACATAAAGRAARLAASPGAWSGTFPAPTLPRRTASAKCCHSTSCCNIGTRFSTRFSAEADVDMHLAQPPGSRADVSMAISAGELEFVPQGPGRPRHAGAAGCACDIISFPD